MSFPRKGENLHSALRAAYAGPYAAKRLARDTGYSERAAKQLLAGLIPSQWQRFIDLINKRPTILELVFKDDWATHLALTREINETRARLLQMEKRLAGNTKNNRVATD